MGFDQNNSFFRFSRMFNKQKGETKIDSSSIFVHMCASQEWGHPISLFWKSSMSKEDRMFPTTFAFYLYVISSKRKGHIAMDIKQNLTNVHIYDCMDLSLCQVHCCKYGEQIKKRPCCHSIVHFYAVFSTRSKICTQKRLAIYFWNNSQSKKFQISIERNLQHIGRRIGLNQIR